MEKILADNLKGSIAAKEEFARTQSEAVFRLVRAIASSLKNGGKLLLFGNGGSAADAQHVAAEFVNRFLIDRPPLAAVALTTDSSILTSIGNDFSFDDLFSKQIIALGREGDIALGISTSGTSPNVVQGLEAARDKGLVTAALTGGNGGVVKDLADHVLIAPTSFTPHIQEVHLWVEHLLCQLVDEVLFGTLSEESQ
jgi:D-sedoheptulose 7-phosphate isomerase